MGRFTIDAGGCGTGAAIYRDGLFTLPDGAERGIETLRRVEVEAEGSDIQSTTSALAGSLRGMLDPPALALPWRLAVSGMRAGLGAIEEGLRRPDGVRVALTFMDEALIVARMAPDLAEQIAREAALVRAAFERADRSATAPAALPAPVLALPPPAAAAEPAPTAPVAPAASEADEAALTSIFRYEKRNGRLRRVPVSDPRT